MSDTANKPSIRAKRGFIAIACKSGMQWHTGKPTSGLRVTVGTVDSVTRDGDVKTVAPCGGGVLLRNDRRDWDQVYLVDPATLADPAGFLAECADRQTPSLNTWRPFAGLDDVRETAREYKA